MTSREAWLEEICIFMISDHEFHLYLGNYENPRSTMVIIRGKRISSAIKVPPSSLSNLRRRYPEQQLKLEQIHPTIKYILGILGIVKLSTVYISSSDKLNLNNDEIAVYNWEEFEKYKGIFGAVPISEELQSIIDTDISTVEDIELFDQILSHPDRSIRQKTLTRLIKNDNRTVMVLLFLLYKLRDELMISIIRELGRQRKPVQFIQDYCYHLIQTEDKVYHRFGLHYLYQFDHESILKLPTLQNYRNNVSEYFFNSPVKRHRKLLQQLEQKGVQQANAFHIFEQIQDREKLFYEIRRFQSFILKEKVEPKLLQSSLIDLIQFGETSSSTHIISIVISFCSIYDQLILGEDITLKSELNRAFRHIKNRILSLLYLWQELGFTKQVHEVLSLSLQILPSLETTDMDITEELLHDWISKHPIYSLYQKDIISIINEEETIIAIAENLFFGKHIFLHYVAEKFITRNQLERHYSIQTVCAAFYQFELNLPEDYSISKNISINSIQELPKDYRLFSIAININSYLDIPLFTTIITNSLSHSNLIDILENYLKHVSRLSKDLIPQYFDILSDIIENEYSHDDNPPYLNRLIKEIVVRWQEITSLFPEETIQYQIDAYKILYQAELEDFDLETSKPLAIETITKCYKMTDGIIPKFIEGNIQFSFTKPVWDQLARHYLAMGIERPERDAIVNSKLKEVPNYLLRDVLGQIALVNQTLSYSEKHGFRPSLENLIINNMYRRGWNVERGLERKLPSLLGASSSKLRSYMSTYLVVDQGEISLDILKWARDVDDYLLRDRIIRELERYGTHDMWVILANAYHPDIRRNAINQLRESRMSTTDRSQVIVNLLHSPDLEVRQIGYIWLEKYEVQQSHLIELFNIDYKDSWNVIINYLIRNQSHLCDEHQYPLFLLIRRLLWKVNIPLKILNDLTVLIPHLNEQIYKNKLKTELQELAKSGIQSKIEIAIQGLSKMED